MASALTCFSNLVKCFVTTELMRWPGIVSIYGEFLRKTLVFSSEKRWEDLHTRVIEHVSSKNHRRLLFNPLFRTSVLWLSITVE